MTRPAKLKDRGIKVVWMCPTCGRTLGEVYNGIVTVKTDEFRMITFPVDAPVLQTCPRCAEVSAIVPKVDAA